ALPVGATSETTFDADGDGTAEEIVFSADGQVTHQSTAGVASEISIKTYVTWEGQDDDGDGTVDVARAARRVTSIATWSDGGQTRTVTESTTISHAERGLPVPNFGTQPQTASATVPPGFTTSDSCPSDSKFEHTLTNVGAEDSYEVTIDGNGETVDLLADGTTFASANTNWAAQVHLTPTGGSQVLMDDRSPMGDDYVEAYDSGNAEIRVGTGDSVVLTFCYVPDGTVKKATFSVTVRSRFDNAIVETLTHNLFVANTAITLYLHDPDNTQDHQRKNSPSIFVMDTTATTQSSGPFDYDTNLDPDAMDGLYLKDGDTSSSVTWDYQTPSEVTLNAATLKIWGAMAGWSNSSDKVVFSITLQHVNKNGNSVLLDLSPDKTSSTTPDLTLFPGADRTFVSDSLSWTFADRTIPAQDRLRLKLTCHGDSTDDCHVLYDHANFLSNLAVTG
ncbi:MAG: hypothetical protein R3324_10860, partial [Halobacteriales archaeon]|nr:hypothetical protein [Halobacteriales archaeon]